MFHFFFFPRYARRNPYRIIGLSVAKRSSPEADDNSGVVEWTTTELHQFPRPQCSRLVIGSAIDCRDASGSIEIGLKSHYLPIRQNTITRSLGHLFRRTSNFLAVPRTIRRHFYMPFHTARQNLHHKRFGYLRFRLERWLSVISGE